MLITIINIIFWENGWKVFDEKYKKSDCDEKILPRYTDPDLKESL